MSWLPQFPTPSNLEGMRPWRPPTLTDPKIDVTRLTYIAVDEIIGEQVRLSLSGWPFADQVGRLRFPVARGSDSVIVDRDDFCRFLSDCGYELLPEPPDQKSQHRRHLRISDVFAAELRSQARRSHIGRVDQWIVKPVYDITIDARDVAKLAYYGAVTDVWTEGRAKKYKLVAPPNQTQ